MALSEFEVKKHEKALTAFVERNRPPPSIRDKVDLSFRVDGKAQSVEIFEVRHSVLYSKSKIEEPVAKAVYVKKRLVWKVFWEMADLKWHAYYPAPEVDTLEEFIALVEEDSDACFWG